LWRVNPSLSRNNYKKTTGIRFSPSSHFFAPPGPLKCKYHNRWARHKRWFFKMREKSVSGLQYILQWGTIYKIVIFIVEIFFCQNRIFLMDEKSVNTTAVLIWGHRQHLHMITEFQKLYFSKHFYWKYLKKIDFYHWCS
jgi:hypothetical protein